MLILSGEVKVKEKERKVTVKVKVCRVTARAKEKVRYGPFRMSKQEMEGLCGCTTTNIKFPMINTLRRSCGGTTADRSLGSLI